MNSRHRFATSDITYMEEGIGGPRVMSHSHHRSLLTKREREIFQLLVKDFSTKEIATQLHISEKTVRNHISNTIQKLGVSGRAQAMIELLRLGELSLG